MKETNMEHFRSEIEAIMEKAGFGIFNGDIARCGDCPACWFSGWQNDDTARCEERKIKWLMSEYRPEITLTEREKHFVEFAQEGWLARDMDGVMTWFMRKPNRSKEEDLRCWNGPVHAFAFNKLNEIFSFITWDEEPWSVEELRKLKVEE